jgi:hypothetical protein
MPELKRFTTALILNPFNKICHAMVVSARELAFYLNPAQHAVKEREMGKGVSVKAPGKNYFLDSMNYEVDNA